MHNISIEIIPYLVAFDKNVFFLNYPEFKMFHTYNFIIPIHNRLIHMFPRKNMSTEHDYFFIRIL